MPTDKQKLAVFADRANIPRSVPLPTPADVLYAGPNADGSRKKCENCVLWMPESRQCWIMSARYVVPADAICGYHVYGTPSDRPRAAEMSVVEPAFSGFEQVRDGTSCGSCAYFAKGSCEAVIDARKGTPAKVDALGCCSRWRRRA